MKSIFTIFLVFFISVTPIVSVNASQATSYTFSLNEKGYYVRTQDAYLPDKTVTELNLSHPEDLFVDSNNVLYIADTGNKRIVKYDINSGKIIGILENDVLKSPKGVFVTKNGDIYIADSAAKTVFHFDKNFKLLDEFGKPTSPSFADTPFEPMRIAVDNRGNMYIIGEGVYNGVIQLSNGGEFLGYFTVNKTTMNLWEKIQDFLFTNEQKAALIDKVPVTFSNVFIDNSGIVYTTTMGTLTNGVKKHNTSGSNMFKEPVFNYISLTDIYVNSQGIIFACDKIGTITVYSSSGEIIFDFGSMMSNQDISGLYTSLSTIAIDNNGNIWTADGEKSYLQSFRPTDYALMVFDALELFEQGLYNEAKSTWEEVLKLNQMSILAHNGIGKAYLYENDYENAMVHFEVSGNRDSYSEAYWEVRNIWLQTYLQYFIIFIAVSYIAIAIYNKFDKKKRLKYATDNFKDKLFNTKILGDVLYCAKVPFKPIDCYYDIKIETKGTVLGASIIYILFFSVYMIYQTSKGFIYQFITVEDMDINSIVIGFFAIVILFIVCNYLVTSINDGEGNLKQVFLIPAYGALPCFIAMISVIFLSYYLTFNESFMLEVIILVGILWSGITIFLGLQTVHDYTTRTTIKSLIITLIFMVIVAIVLLIIIIMWDQVWQFLQSIAKELIRNVFTKS